MEFVQVRKWNKPLSGHLGCRLDTRETLINLHAIKSIEDGEVEDYNGVRYSLVAVDKENRFPWGSRIEDSIVKIGE